MTLGRDVGDHGGHGGVARAAGSDSDDDATAVRLRANLFDPYKKKVIFESFSISAVSQLYVYT